MNILAIGAHPDDIEIGCGGALFEHADNGDQLTMLVMTAGDRGPKAFASRMDEQREAALLLGAELIMAGLPDGGIPSDYSTVQLIERVMNDVKPDIVYTHSAGDTHQDHRRTARATLSAARRHSRVLCYESPSSVGFNPFVFIDIEESIARKLELIRCHVSQVLGRGAVDLEAIEAQARHRGFQAKVRSAESFETHRFLWSIPRNLDGEELERPHLAVMTGTRSYNRKMGAQL